MTAACNTWAAAAKWAKAVSAAPGGIAHLLPVSAGPSLTVAQTRFRTPDRSGNTGHRQGGGLADRSGNLSLIHISEPTRPP